MNDNISYRVSSPKFIENHVELPNHVDRRDPRLEGFKAAERIINDVYGDSQRRTSSTIRKKIKAE